MHVERWGEGSARTCCHGHFFDEMGVSENVGPQGPQEPLIGIVCVGVLIWDSVIVVFLNLRLQS